MGDHEMSIKLPGERNEYLIIEEYNGITSLVLGNVLGVFGFVWGMKVKTDGCGRSGAMHS